MVQFLKYLFASCLGVILAGVVLFGIGAIILTSMASSADKPEEVGSNSILHLKLDQLIPEHTNNAERTFFVGELELDDFVGVHDIIDCIEAAAEDDNIKGIYLDLSTTQAGLVMRSMIRESLMDFREKSGKFVVAYAPYYDQSTYLLASAADEIFLHPMGMVEIKGYAAIIPFMKDMFNKLGIEWDIFYAGKFKSATEPYRRNSMSDEARLQTREYLESRFGLFLEQLSESRNIPVSTLQELATNYSVRNAEDALEAGLVDQIGYLDDVQASIRKRIGLDEEDKIKSTGLVNYNKVRSEDKDFSTSNKIAIVYAEGAIVDGEGQMGGIGSSKYVRILQKIRKDEDIKAIVLRVNSPGGSALASEDIWRELTLAKNEGKPIVVSMGDLAASGGYYISAAADSIFANPGTLTGSIGVFGMIPNANELLNDKLGIHFDTVKTDPLADGLFTPFYEMSGEKKEIVQAMIGETYKRFKMRVSEGRNLDTAQVQEIAQGRVWTGLKAKEIGLVDELGDLDRALASAVRMTNLEKYRITEYPKLKDPIQELIEELTGQGDKEIQAAFIEEQLGQYARYYRHVKEILQTPGPQARLPFIIEE